MYDKLLKYIFIFLVFPTFSFAKTIAEKEFKEVGKPVFVVDGYVNFFAALSNQATNFERKILPDGFSSNNLDEKNYLENDTQIFFKTGVKTTDDAKYGAVAKVEFNANTSRFNEKPNLDQAYLFSEQKFGNFEVGNYFAANQTMKVGPARFTHGAGGINGKYLEYVNLPMATSYSNANSPNIKLPQFILLAQSPIGHGGYAKSFHSRNVDNNYSENAASYGAFNRSNFRSIKDNSFEGMEDATKITYYTPRIEGLQIGLSYAPQSNSNGFTQTTVYDSNQARLENIFSAGVNYTHDFDNINLLLSATAEKSQVKNSKSTYGVQRQDLMAYDLGFSVSYFGFDFGASYGNWGSSLQAKNGTYAYDNSFSNPYYYTLGLAYNFGPIGASLTSLKSTFQKNDYSAISLGLDYKLKRDLMPYFEVTKFEFKSNQAQIQNNQGYVFLTGILYSF